MLVMIFVSTTPKTNLYSKDGIVMWCPLYDTDSSSGGLTIYENSHKYGFFPHRLGKNLKKFGPRHIQ